MTVPGVKLMISSIRKRVDMKFINSNFKFKIRCQPKKRIPTATIRANVNIFGAFIGSKELGRIEQVISVQPKKRKC